MVTTSQSTSVSTSQSTSVSTSQSTSGGGGGYNGTAVTVKISSLLASTYIFGTLVYVVLS